MYKADAKRMQDKITTFSKYGDAGHGGITRYSLSPEAHMARDEFVKRMKAIGAEITTDDLACIQATIPGSDPDAKRIIMQSHCDSVKNGGNYDGIYGVMTAMEVLECVVTQNIPHKHPLTAQVTTNEEGSLYPPAMMCAGIICNDLLPDEIAKNFRYDDMMASKAMEAHEGSAPTFGEALAASPYKGDKKNRLNADDYCCMIEAHIEQGPILEDNGNAVGAVQCVLGMFNYSLIFKGFAAHAGTFPMDKRHDALYAAAQALCYLHDEVDKLGHPELVYTTGEIYAHPCIHTVIPDEVEFSLDVRHEDPKVLAQVMDIVKDIAARKWAGCDCEYRENWKRDTVYWDKDMVGFVEDACRETGVKWQKINSGAGHDAQFFSYMMPTTMIFIRSEKGLSHCEPEHSSLEDCTDGATVALNAILKADEFYK
ncbi:MAG: Zn-dependent hydrolase [Anaerovoracaceae bacterium]|jgi:N-carbamoyl-L-amino-acid hydrolase